MILANASPDKKKRERKFELKLSIHTKTKPVCENNDTFIQSSHRKLVLKEHNSFYQIWTVEGGPPTSYKLDQTIWNCYAIRLGLRTDQESECKDWNNTADQTLDRISEGQISCCTQEVFQDEEEVVKRNLT